MPQIGTADITYTQLNANASPGKPMVERTFTIAYGDGSLTYTNGGIPITKAKVGCPNAITSFVIYGEDRSAGHVHKWNQTASTIQIFRQSQDGTPTTTHLNLVEMATSAAVSATTLRVKVEGF